MKLYELTYLLSPDLSEEELKSLQEKINSFIEKEGGIINELTLPLKKVLAYPIKKKTFTHLGTLSFQFSPEKLENLEKKLKSENQILRYLILAKELPKKVVLPPKLPLIKPKPKPKVELKEIEKKLEEILGE